METKNKEIISSNILIAEFMGGEPVNKVKDNPIAYSFPFQFGHNESWDEGGFLGISKSSCWYIEELQYHLSWEWLMPVVEKIDDIAITTIGGHKKNIDKLHQFSIVYGGSEFIFTKSKSKIEAVYFGVVEFIKWYNNESNR